MGASVLTLLFCVCVCLCVYVFLGTASLCPQIWAAVRAAAIAAASQAEEGNWLIVPTPPLGKESPAAPQPAPQRGPQEPVVGAPPSSQEPPGENCCLGQIAVLSSPSFCPARSCSSVRTGLKQNVPPLNMAPESQPGAAGRNQPQTSVKLVSDRALESCAVDALCKMLLLQNPARATLLTGYLSPASLQAPSSVHEHLCHLNHRMV